jgi:hypothetical protein
MQYNDVYIELELISKRKELYAKVVELDDEDKTWRCCPAWRLGKLESKVHSQLTALPAPFTVPKSTSRLANLTITVTKAGRNQLSHRIKIQRRDERKCLPEELSSHSTSTAPFFLRNPSLGNYPPTSGMRKLSRWLRCGGGTNLNIHGG